ncbi:MAG: hypothetical protein JO085_05345 [Acidimicrobiia bacterium]|nr:hypothetical protein [Acidimicrobiia bacterium]
MISDDEVRRVSRRLRDLVEPLAANVYFAPEAQQNYEALGLSYLPSYFRSRSACMGDVAGEVVVATFGVFNPAIVLPAMAAGRTVAVDDILDARERGATAALRRILDGAPDGPNGLERATELLRRAGAACTCEGHAIFAGLRSRGFPGDPIGAFWRAADLVREHRGDSHIIAWTSHDVDAVEVTLLTELWWRLPLNSYVGTRGWAPDEIDAGIARLVERGLIDPAGNGFTPSGEQVRASIEAATDRQERRVVAALGTEADELLGLLEPWSKAVLASGGYPTDPASLTRP